MIVRYAKHRKCSNLSSIRLCEVGYVSVVAKNDIAKIDSANKTLKLRIIDWDMSPLIDYYQQQCWNGHG